MVVTDVKPSDSLAGSRVTIDAPISSLDLFADSALADPYPGYKSLRELGGAVYLEQLGYYAYTGYEHVKAGLSDWKTYSSAQSVTMNDHFNTMVPVSVLVSDPPQHDRLRKVFGRPLTSSALQALRDRIAVEARDVAQRIADKGSFDVVRDLARHLPLTIVSHLVGLPESGRQKMLKWAFATFDLFGPPGPRTADALALVEECFAFCDNYLNRENAPEGSWHAGVFAALDRGELSHVECLGMLKDYLVPSLDTTISAISNAVWLFANNPEEWNKVRGDARLIPSAINEIVRIESPIQGFSRLVTEEVHIGEARIPAGERVIMLYGSANRDEAFWDEPTRFDVARRSAVDQLGFGHGMHRCAGANLARLEIASILEALIPHVASFQVKSEKRALNSVIRGWESMQVEIETSR